MRATNDLAKEQFEYISKNELLLALAKTFYYEAHDVVLKN